MEPEGHKRLSSKRIAQARNTPEKRTPPHPHPHPPNKPLTEGAAGFHRTFSGRSLSTLLSRFLGSGSGYEACGVTGSFLTPGTARAPRVVGPVLPDQLEGPQAGVFLSRVFYSPGATAFS